MRERLYTEYPELYDAIQSGWDYERDVSFVEKERAHHGIEGDRLLEIGCGTGEHTRRFVTRGFDVTAIDKYKGMLEAARAKCDANFCQMALPDISLDGVYDMIVMIRGVVNHLPPKDLSPAFEVLTAHLAEDGIVVFDNSPLPGDGNHPGLDIGTTDRGDYARIAQHVPTKDGRLDWRTVTFTPDGEFFVDSRMMTPFDDETIANRLDELGFEVEMYDGYGPDDRRTVFVGSA